MLFIVAIKGISSAFNKMKPELTINDLVRISIKKSRYLSKKGTLYTIALQNQLAARINRLLVDVTSGETTLTEFEENHPQLERQPATECDDWAADYEQHYWL